MKHRAWTDADLAVLDRDYANTPTKDLADRLDRPINAVYRKAQLRGLKKSPAYLDSDAACRLHSGNNVGARGRFQKGLTPWNKGMKGWQAGGRSKETQFRPGHRRGRAAQIYQPIGAERITKDGYLQRKVNDDMPLQRRWRMVHHLVWEEHHGPIPTGHAVRFINGDKSDIRIDNLELISRRDLMARNTVHNLPKELAEVCQLKGAVTRQINKRTKT